MGRTPPRRRTRFVLGIVFAAALLGLAEVGARLAGVTPAYKPNAMGQWRMTPNLQSHRMTGMREPHNFRISTNADGFRTAEAAAPSDARTRVVVMGDSTVFGWGVEDHEGIAETAQAALEESGTTTIEVLNFGQPGYSTGMAGWLFEEAVAAYQPDLTIVFVSMHDFNRSLLSDVERVHGARTWTASVRSLLVRHVALYEVLRRRLFPLADKAQLLPNEATAEARVARVSPTERARVLDRMQAVASEWGGAVSIGFLPFYADFGSNSSAQPPRPGVADAEQWSAANQRPLFDLRACCSGPASERTFPFDHGHLNALGNREVGIALAEAISRHLSPQDQ
ncbi:MAG: SGNH/GDSL hydrolase family protein [Myxococcota bacterium]|nr:SGNH/GDSL hydrolase family protein [Myxococcota bacterium]